MAVIKFLINLKQLNLNNEFTLNIKQLLRLLFYKYVLNLLHDRFNLELSFNSLC